MSIEFRSVMRRLDPRSPETDELVKGEGKRIQAENLFGSVHLRLYDSAKDQGRKVDDIFSPERRKLARIVHSNGEHGFDAGFYELSQLITEYLNQTREQPDSPSEEVSEQQLLETLKQNDAKNDPLLIDLLRLHVTKMEERRRAILEDEKKFKPLFITAVLQAIDDGWLPMDKHQAIKKMDRIPPILVPDFLSEPSYSSAAHYGVGHVGINFERYFTPHTPDEWKQHAFFHEWTHFLSGESLAQVETIATFEDGEQDVASSQVLSIKSGLRFGLPAREDVPARELSRDLNEGVTDTVAQQLQGKTNDFFYTLARAELKRLVDLGVSKRIILEAYFEDPNPELERHPRAGQPAAPAYGKFVREMKAKAGRDIFKK